MCVFRKLLPSVPCTSLLASVAARHSAPCHAPSAVLLLLTQEVLFVVDSTGDSQQQAYAMADISCQQSAADPTVVYVVPRTGAQGSGTSKDKVRALIQVRHVITNREGGDR